MAVIVPHEFAWTKRSVVIRATLVALNDIFEVVLPFPVRVLTSMERALGTTAATTTTLVRGTCVIGTDGKGVGYQTYQTLSTLDTPASVSTHFTRAIQGELTALTGTGGVELIIAGSLE